MKINLVLVSLFFSSVASLSAVAGDSRITGAKITAVEFYGNQFTVYFDKKHQSSACGKNNAVALNSSAEPGKSYMSVFLTAWASNKSIDISITDKICNGDRPTILNWLSY